MAWQALARARSERERAARALKRDSLAVQMDAERCTQELSTCEYLDVPCLVLKLTTVCTVNATSLTTTRRRRSAATIPIATGHLFAQTCSSVILTDMWQSRLKGTTSTRMLLHHHHSQRRTGANRTAHPKQSCTSKVLATQTRPISKLMLMSWVVLMCPILGPC